jgi:glucose/arabinose dehydrogenase
MIAVRLAACVLTTAMAAGACSLQSVPPAVSTAAADSAGQAASVRLIPVRLVVPAGEGGAPFTTPRKLRVPLGWSAKVWARVPDARMEAWTPEGDLLVSEPDNGIVTELVPDAHGTAKRRTLLTGLTEPQGLAFARLSGHWVLYVADSNRLDRYRWGSKGIEGPPAVIVAGLPDLDASGNDVHRVKDLVVTRRGVIFFNVGSSSNANPNDLRMSPPRAVIMSVRPNGTGLHVVEHAVRNGEGLALAPNGEVWTAVNNRDNIPYPFHRAYGGFADAFGKVIQAYVNNHPPDEVVPVVAGRNLGWPYCDPDQDENKPRGSLASIPLVANALTNRRSVKMNCAKLPRINVGLAAHSAPLGMSFLEGTSIMPPWSGGAVVAAHGSWNRNPPLSPAVLWMAWNTSTQTLEPAMTLVTGFQLPNGSRWGRPADVVAGPGGALYVSDDTAGAIYRLMPPK